MSEVQFEIKSDLAVVQNFALEANFAECEKALTEMMAPYQNLVVTEDGIAGAKATRAKIRKVSAHIDDARKMVKKIYSEPLKAFEDKCKKLTAICDSASGNIDTQVKAYEQKVKDEKIARLYSFFETKAQAAGVDLYARWELVKNPKWENAGYSEGTAEQDIGSYIETILQDLETIRSLNSGFEAALLSYYKETGNISAVIRKNADLILMQERERARKEAAEKAAHAAEISSRNAEIPAQENAEPELMTVDFRVWVTQEQLGAIKHFLLGRNIKYGRVPNGNQN